jgi:hypothetical protein
MNDRKFEIRCDAGPDGQLQVRSQGISASIGQLIARSGAEEMWQSVLVMCEEDEEGYLTTKVIICHPDWDQNLQIASIRSRIPEKDKLASVLEFDLKSIQV